MASRLTTLLIFIVCSLMATAVSAEWKRLDSPNFVVMGDVGAADLRNIARKFEAFRETLSRVLTQNTTSAAVPTIVLVFPSSNAFAPFKPLYNGKPAPLSGLVMPRQDATYIAMLRDIGEPGMRSVFHEYAHLVLSTVSDVIPLWLHEGLAEFYSTYELTPDGREALIGRPVPGHLDRLGQGRLLPLEELLKAQRNSPLYNELDRRSVFYAQSWALTHTIVLAQPSKAEQIGRYLDRLASGSAEMEAWQQSFGAELTERQLTSHLDETASRDSRSKVAEKLATPDAPVRSLQQADSEALLANFLVQQQRFDEASQRLGKVPHAEANPWVTIVGAVLDATRSDYDGATKRLLGLELQDDWLLGYFAGSTLAEVIESRRSTDPTHQEAVRRFFEIALRGGREIPDVLARTGTLDLLKREPLPYQTIAGIQRAMKLAPGRSDYRLLYARALAKQSSFAAAATALRPLTMAAYPPQVREAARRALEQIQDLEKAQATSAAAGQVDRDAARAESERETDNAVSSTTAAPMFRTVQDGEDRWEGTLQRIECVKTGVVFHLETAAGPARARAAKMDQVEFITYRDDMAPSIKCGALKEPMHIYLTSRAATDAKGGRIAIAVEFLPKPEKR